MINNYLKLSDEEASTRISYDKKQLGDSCIILCHHYQRDEVFKFSNYVGDSYKLSKIASEINSKYIIFCGVYFMAETADILKKDNQIVILPDLNAGCSMADMAEISQVEYAWEELSKLNSNIIPLTYMNSSAAIKAFVGKHNGLVCTSSNAEKAFKWAFDRGDKILFIPDQHLGRNTGYNMGISLNEMIVYDPYILNDLKLLENSKIILWKGHCSVHQRFLPEHIDKTRIKYPNMKVIVHPECSWEVCQKSDDVGSTEFLIDIVKNSPDGSEFAIGTEIHLVNRLANQYPNKHIITLNECGCLCTTMYRISPQHLCWVLENLVDENIVNQIIVKDNIKQWAKVALNRMLEIS